MRELWVYTQHSGGLVERTSKDLIAKAQRIADGHDLTVCPVVVGKDASEAAKSAASMGVSKVYCAQADTRQEDLLGCAGILSSLAASEAPSIILFPATKSAGILSSVLGVRLKTGVIAHCVDVFINEKGKLVGSVPAFGGKMLGDILCPEAEPQIATVSTGSFELRKSGGPAEIVTVPVSAPQSSGIRLTGHEEEDCTGILLEDAETVVCGGAGLRTRESWGYLNDLACSLNGAVACTRPPLEEDFGASEKMMIGASGKTVAPKVYIGFGVSGSIHHTCGMKDSSVIINVNKDEHAPVFQVSDYGFIGDAAEILPLLIKELGKKRGAQASA